MDAPPFDYSPGWRVTPDGADPPEPDDPWREPAGVVTFTVTSGELWLRLAVGDYWGYLYATVDGAPANALPVIAGNVNTLGQPAGYRTLYAPEQPEPIWAPIYRGLDATRPHEVRLELWRGWGQTPLRGVATVAPPAPRLAPWVGVGMLIAGLWLAVAAWVAHPPVTQARRSFPRLRTLAARLAAIPATVTLGVAGLALLLVAAGVAAGWWLPVVGGLALLGIAALAWPMLWPAALLFGLPFYFSFPLPLLPWRSLSLIDVGLLGGVGLALAQGALRHWGADDGLAEAHTGAGWRADPATGALAAIATWALISTAAADHVDVALREWRTVFLAGLLVALLLPRLLDPVRRQRDGWLLVVAWVAGGTVAALVALWQYAVGENLITAEGVWRVRAFYGSPNNLALYLERTLAVTLAAALFGSGLRNRLIWGGAALAQGAALLLTFSKGALLLGLPALLATLWIGGLLLLRRQGRSLRPLWWVLAAGLAVALAMLPFLGTERFQRLLDLSQGTGFLRLNLWRSAWQMARDHPLLGVGPDNFLYAYRSFYLLPSAWQEPNLNHPHNWLLDWWTRLGAPGLVLALIWFGLMARRLWRGVRQGTQPTLSLGLLAALAAALAHGLIDASYALPDLMIVWALMGAMSATGSSRSPRPT